MAIKLGNTTINGLYLGSTAINKAYLGSTEVFSVGGGAFDPASLFASGEAGAWYDPSDLTTMWTDTAGTTQASVGDAVARIDDKSGNGNHATQATIAARPFLARVPEGGRRNLLEYTEEFSNAVWIKGVDASVAQNATGVDGVPNSAFTLTDSGSSAAGIYQQTSVSANSASYTGTAYFKKTTGASTFPMMGVNFGLATVQGDVIVNTNSGNIADRPGVPPDSSTISDAGDYWKVTVTNANDGSQTTARVVIYPAVSDDGTTIDTSLTGSCVADQIQLEEGSTATAYQKVVSQYDVTEDGVTSLDYLFFDGTDDGMATAAIDFTGTDEMSVFVGLEKANETDGEIVYELSSNWVSNNGAFVLASNVSAGSVDYQSASGGTLSALDVRVNTGDNQPNPAVISSEYNISGDSVVLRVNGAQEGEATGDQGAGNFGNYPLYIGARNDAASLWFDGNLYGLIVRGVTSTNQEISDTESYLADKSGVTL